MRSWKCLVAIAISCLAACTQIDGQCWIDDGSPAGSGVGGGPLVPGGGGYGDAPGPTPQNGSDGRLYFDCDVHGPCENKCLDDFVAAADECAKIQDEDQRKTCQHVAYVRYMTCRQTCKQMDDWRKKCDDEADACEAECRKLPEDDKNARRKCWQRCNSEYGECKRKCKD